MNPCSHINIYSPDAAPGPQHAFASILHVLLVAKCPQLAEPCGPSQQHIILKLSARERRKSRRAKFGSPTARHGNT